MTFLVISWFRSRDVVDVVCGIAVRIISSDVADDVSRIGLARRQQSCFKGDALTIHTGHKSKRDSPVWVLFAKMLPFADRNWNKTNGSTFLF